MTVEYHMAIVKARLNKDGISVRGERDWNPGYSDHRLIKL